MTWLLLMALLVQPQTTVIDWASPEQEMFFRHGASPCCASGGFGSGKTTAAIFKALWISGTFNHNRGVIARRVAKELRQTTMATFFKHCPPQAYLSSLGGRRNDQDGYLRLNNGSEILFMHFEDPSVQGVLKGLEINWFFIDQAEESSDTMEDVFDVLLGRLGRWDKAEVPDWLIEQERKAGRPWQFVHPTTGKPQPPPYAMLAVNPDTELHWVYRRFHPESPDYQGRFKRLGYRLYDIPTLNNKFLGETNREYLLAHDDAFLHRYVYGRWGLPEGAIHVIPPESLIAGSYELLDYFRNHCSLFRTLDHGDTSPTCCLWWAVDKDGNVFCYREYYMPNALISTHRQNITGLSEGERYGVDYADPSIFSKLHQKNGGRWSTADEYSDVREHPRDNALFWQPADNNELGTRNRISEYLFVHPERIHPITKAKGSPRLFFVTPTNEYPQGCVHVLQQTRSQRRVKVGTELGRPVFSDERDETITDHAYDCLRYFIASRAPRAVDPLLKVKPGTFDYAARLLDQYQRQHPVNNRFVS